jgi:RNase H-fold protein (predicted Holliday junction resolvase)
MAEVLGILAGSIAVGQLTEQIVRGTRNLHDFWHSVRDAPKDIELLLEELKILGDTLTELQSDPGSQAGSELRGPAFTNCLQYCKKTSDELQTVILGLKHNMDGKKVKLQWGAVKAAFQKGKLQDFQQRLEKAKSMLTLAINCYSLYMVSYSTTAQGLTFVQARTKLQTSANKGPIFVHCVAVS